jgi:site-specific DNA-methyltransferase (adenine-specific)
MSDAELCAVPMSRQEAEQVTDRIRRHLEEGRQLVRMMIARRGWEALGYPSCEEWAARSFGWSARHVDRLMVAAQIGEMLEIEGPGPMVSGADPMRAPVPEGTLRPLTALFRTGRGEHSQERPDARGAIREAWDLARERSDGQPTAKDVQAAVAVVQAREASRKVPGEVPGPVPVWSRAGSAASAVVEDVAGHQVLMGDARDVIATLPVATFQLCVTSPPYFKLRDYRSGDEREIGREPSPTLYIDHLVEIFGALRRVLRRDAVAFVVIGDTYSRDGNLFGIPFRLAEALQQDGWVWRDTIIRSKAWVNDDGELHGGCMPGSQQDRCTSSYEFVLQLTLDRDYYFDIHGERSTSEATLRNVWQITTGGGSTLPHFAMMALPLALRCIRLGTPAAGCCPQCRTPWRRRVESDRRPTRPGTHSKVFYQDKDGSPYAQHNGSVIGNRDPLRRTTSYTTIGWEPGCSCAAGDPAPARVIDPFGGVGTSAVAALQLGRESVSIELSAEYCDVARRRLAEESARLAAGEGVPDA